MDYVRLYDGSMRLLAVLENAADIGYSLVHNDLWTGDFSLPSNDPKCSYCQPGALVTIPDGQRMTGLYRVSGVPDANITGLGETTTYHVEHVLSTLLDDIIFGALEVTDQAPADAIRQVLGMQTVQRWVLGTCDFSQPISITLGNETLLSALQKICGQLPDEYTWSFDTTSLPWALHVRRADAEESCGIHYARNLVEIRKTVDASQLVTRLYLLGGSDTSGQQVTVESLTAGNVPYIDADTISTWGEKSAIYQNGDLVTPEALLARGREVLESRKNPCYTYEATALDLYQLTGYEWDRYEPGKRVLVMDDERGIHFAARIVSVSKQDVRGDPGSITITIANQPRDELGTVTAIVQKTQQVETQIIRNAMETHGLVDRVTTIDGTVSYLTNTAEGLRHAISTNTGTLSVLENTLEGLKHQVQDGLGNVSTLTNTVNGMTSTVERVDGTVSTLTNTAEGLKHQITDNAGKLATLENTIEGMKSQVSDGAGNVSTLTNTVNGMTSTVERVDGTVSTLTNTAEGLKHQITDNAGKLATLENTIEGMKSQVQDGLGNVSTLTNTVDGMTSTVERVDGTVSTLTNTAEGLRHDITDNAGKLATLENTIEGMKSQVQDGLGNVSTLTNTVNGMTSTVERVDGTVSTLTNTAEGLRHDITDNAGKLATLENTIEGMKSQVQDGLGNVSTLTNTVNGMTSTVERVDGTVSTLTNTAEGLKHQITDNAGKLATLENTIDGLKHQVSDGAGNLSTLTNTVEGMTSTVKDVDGRTAQFKVRVDKIEGTVYDETGNSRITQLAGNVEIQAQRNDGQDSTISLKADKTYVDKLIADEISAMRGDFNNLTSGVTTASSLYTNSFGCQDGRITNLEVANHAAPWQSMDVLTDVDVSYSTATSPPFYTEGGVKVGTITYVKSVSIGKTTTKILYLGRTA